MATMLMMAMVQAMAGMERRPFECPLLASHCPLPTMSRRSHMAEEARKVSKLVQRRFESTPLVAIFNADDEDRYQKAVEECEVCGVGVFQIWDKAENLYGDNLPECKTLWVAGTNDIREIKRIRREFWDIFERWC